MKLIQLKIITKKSSLLADNTWIIVANCIKQMCSIRLNSFPSVC